MITNGCSSRSRTHSADDSLDDLGTDEAGSPYTSLSGNDRKRRRGVIEKRRRDRINCSLADLKRLVPDSNHKTGSSKLEKAEILQLTVDFLQRLHKEGYVLTSEARAFELRRYGFKDCFMEVQRLLSTFEGVPLSGDDLRRHLLAHLQQCERQRETEAKSYLTQIAAVTNAMLTQTSSTPDTVMDDLQSCCPQVKSKLPKLHAHVGKTKLSTHSESLTNNLTNCPTVTTNDQSVYVLDSSNGRTAFHLNSTYTYPSTDPRLTDTHPHLTASRYASSHYNPSYPIHMESLVDSANYPSSFSLSSGKSLSCYAYNSNLCTNYTSSTALSSGVLTTTTPTMTSTTSTILSSTTKLTNTNNSLISTDLINQPNSNLTILGPNESQSTSSPPFHSTPENSDLGLSPLVVKTTSHPNSLPSSNQSDPCGIQLTDSNKCELDNSKISYYSLPPTNSQTTTMMMMNYDQLTLKNQYPQLDYPIGEFGSNPSEIYSTDPLGYHSGPNCHPHQSPLKNELTHGPYDHHQGQQPLYYHSNVYMDETQSSSSSPSVDRSQSVNRLKPNPVPTGSLDYPNYGWAYSGPINEIRRSS